MSERERTYSLIKIAAGDWILPSNDGQRFYRLDTYEDGPSLGLDLPSDRKFWRVHRLKTDPHGLSLHDMSEWYDLDTYTHQWESIEWLLPTRKDAVEAALAYDERNNVHNSA